MPLYILDTDVLSNLRKEKRHPVALAWVQRTGWAQISTTVINLAEIQCGIERQMASNPDYARGTQAWMNGMLQDGGPSVWPLSLEAALILARMHESPRLRNFVLPDPRQKSGKSPGDLAVAAIAIDRGAIVATRNVKHFEAINAVFPLPGVYDPFSDRWSVAPASVSGATR